MSLPVKLFQRGKSWYTRWYDTVSGTKQWRKLGPTKSLADTALRALQAKLIGGPAKQHKRITLSQYYNNHYQPDYLSNGTYWQSKVRHMIETRILPHWGMYALADISLYEAESWYKSLLANHSRKYANHIAGTLKTMLSRAAGTFIAASPIANLRKSAPEKRVPATLTRAQIEHLSNTLEGRDRVLILVWLMTGLRPAEIRWLKWCDLDLDTGKLFVRTKKPEQGTTGPRARGHKIKDAEERMIVLTAAAQKLLQDYHGEHLRTDDEFVFPGANGGPWLAMTKHVAALFRSRGIPHGNSLLLRHTFASMLLSGGCNLAELKSFMGHSSITITEQHYAAFLPPSTSSIHRIDFGISSQAREQEGSRIAGKITQRGVIERVIKE